MACVGVFQQADDAFRGRFVRGASFYLGRISYSVYLFHLMIVMALKPMIASAPLVLQLAIYVALILTLSTIFFAGFERPILAARPYYTAARGEAAAALAAPRGAARRFRPSLVSIALALAALGAGVLAWRRSQAAGSPKVEPPKTSTEPKEEPISASLAMDDVKIELGYGLLHLINDLEGRRLTDQIKALRKTLASEYGFVMPPVRILALHPHAAVAAMHEHRQ